MRLVITIFILLTFQKSFGQLRCEAYPPQFFIETGAKFGGVYSIINSINQPSLNYPDAINPEINKLKMSLGGLMNLSVSSGFYFSKERNMGIGVGVFFNDQVSNLSLDNFHIEYSATDFKGTIFRQSVTSTHPINEFINIPSIGIPITFLYRKELSKKHMKFISLNCGLVLNFQLPSSYTTNANFDYEAIYKFVDVGNGQVGVYDNSPIPNSTDWLLTQKEYKRNNPNGDIESYFAIRNKAGYSVGLNEKVNNTSGKFKFNTQSFGWVIEASYDVRLKKKIFLRYGCYLLSMDYANPNQTNNQTITSKILRDNAGNDIGVNYNPLAYNIGFVQNISFGVNVGLKFYISRNSLWDYQQYYDQILDFPKHKIFP